MHGYCLIQTRTKTKFRCRLSGYSSWIRGWIGNYGTPTESTANEYKV